MSQVAQLLQPEELQSIANLNLFARQAVEGAISTIKAAFLRFFVSMMMRYQASLVLLLLSPHPTPDATYL